MLWKTPALLRAAVEGQGPTQRMLAEMRKTGRWSGEVRFRRSNGVEGVCEAIVVPHSDDYGRTIAVIFVHRDVTEKKRLEERLRRLQAQKPRAAQGPLDSPGHRAATTLAPLGRQEIEGHTCSRRRAPRPRSSRV